ncbi:hypothetical protein NliqN6_3099 [Naganishia liquefaciens]|uniref:Uncharacterized protein n=1 Tax=Naganishia liquefaciens TaxID=104408 RepID=A0A8H3YFY9_9TREE|nr:hypothetical protein NliqN6_3099 [Naganishia liquefaciens]
MCTITASSQWQTMADRGETPAPSPNCCHYGDGKLAQVPVALGKTINQKNVSSDSGNGYVIDDYMRHHETRGSDHEPAMATDMLTKADEVKIQLLPPPPAF